MPLARKAATEFVAKLRPDDVAEVVNFDSRVEILQRFTNNRALLEAAIQRVGAGGSTALYNGVRLRRPQLVARTRAGYHAGKP